MKLGMPTLIEFKTLEQNVRLCKELKLDFIELNMNLPICLPENLSYQERCKETLEWARSSGIKTLNMHLNNDIYFTL